MYRAPWAGEVVRPDGAEDVRQVSGEARQPLLGPRYHLAEDHQDDP